MPSKSLILSVVACLFAASALAAASVMVDIETSHPGNAKVTKQHAYSAMVTLSIENPDGTLTPSGWSTRKENGGDGRPFEFTPGRNLIQGWTDGVLQMREGERARIHVPAALGYGVSPQGSKGGPWYIPGNSNLLFDIEILHRVGNGKPVPADL